MGHAIILWLDERELEVWRDKHSWFWRNKKIDQETYAKEICFKCKWYATKLFKKRGKSIP